MMLLIDREFIKKVIVRCLCLSKFTDVLHGKHSSHRLQDSRAISFATTFAENQIPHYLGHCSQRMWQRGPQPTRLFGPAAVPALRWYLARSDARVRN